ncbi:MAG: hypothetical protein PHH08_00105 [Candidatus ainarchaeum sp.]|nr:hypothetical protein [Candidatus ainarchaeum sp.]
MQKEFFRRFSVFLLCISIVFLSGCISEEASETERFLCLDLTNRPFALVPKCASQEKCFEEADSRLFDFDSGVLPYDSRSELVSLKNSLASSWLFFNKAGENIRAINSACSSGGDFSGLAGQVNELNYSLAKAFEFSDKANYSAFSIVSAEEKNLEEEKIFLAKEEPLYNDFALINRNLNDLQSQNLESGTFAGAYLKEMHSLNALMKRTGFERDFIEETTAIDFFEKYAPDITKGKEAERVFKIPFFGDAIGSFVSFLNDFLKINSASEALSKMPAFEYLQAYGSLAGSENSAISNFSLLLRNDCLHRQALIERNAGLELQITGKINSASEKIALLSSSRLASFDANFLAELYSLLGQDSEIATQKFSIQDFSNFREKAVAELLPLSARFSETRQKDFLGTLPLGEETLSLKEIDSRLSSLLENLSFLENESLSGLEVLCRERTKKISASIEEQKIPDSLVVKASDLKARIKFRISEFNGSKETYERLFLCKRTIEEFNDFRLAVEGFEEYSLKEEIIAEECFSFLEKIFSSGQSAFDLSDFKTRFQKIKNLETRLSGIENKGSLCASLESDTLAFLKGNYRSVLLKKGFSNAREKLETLEIIDGYSEQSVPETALSNFREKIAGLKKYFSGENIIFEKALPVFQELEESVFSLEESLESGLDSVIAVFSSKTSAIEFFSEPCESQDLNLKVRITANNPFRATGRIALKIPFAYSFKKLALPENFFLSGETLAIGLDSLPLGISFFDFFGTRESEKKQETQQADANQAAKTAYQEPAAKKPETNAVQGPAVQKQASSDYAKKISGQKAGLLEKTASFWNQLVSLNETESFAENHDSLLALDSEIDRSLALGDFNKANSVLSSLEQETGSFTEKSKAFLKEKTDALSKRIASFEESVSKKIPEKVSSLLSIIESVPEETLFKLGYVAPVSKERLQKMQLQLGSLNSEKLAEQFSKFRGLVSKEKFSDAILGFSEFEKDLAKKETELNSMGSEADSALYTLKEDSFSAMNSASAALDSGQFNAEALDLVGKAKTYFDKGQFLKTIAVSNAALAVLADPKPFFDIPVFLYPVLAGIALVFVARHKKKQIRTEKEQFRKILRNRQAE